MIECVKRKKHAISIKNEQSYLPPIKQKPFCFVTIFLFALLRKALLRLFLY